MSLRDWLVILLLGAIWGCSFLFNAVLIREIGPLWVAAGRVSIAACASWVFLLALQKPIPRDPVLWFKLGILGIFSYVVPFSLFPLGQAHIPSGLAAIINALLPILTVVVSHFWPGGEKAKPHKLAGVAAGFAGAVLLASPAFASGGSAQLWAIATCLLAVLAYAVTLNVARAFAKLDPTTLATLALTGASLVSVPTALLTEGMPHITRPETWAAWLALGLFPTFIAFQIMYRFLPRIGANNMSTNTFVTPVSAIILGMSLLGEVILPIQLLGMAGIFLGLLLIDGRILMIGRKAPA